MNCLKIVLVLALGATASAGETPVEAPFTTSTTSAVETTRPCTNYTGDWSHNSQDPSQPLFFRFRFIQPDCQHVQIFSINEDASVDEIYKLELPRIKSNEIIADGKLTGHSLEFSYMDRNGDLFVGNFTFKIGPLGQVSNQIHSQTWKLNSKKNQLTLITIKHGDDRVENSSLLFDRITTH